MKNQLAWVINSHDARKVYRYIKGKGSAARRDVSDALDMQERRTGLVLRTLKRCGLLHLEGYTYTLGDFKGYAEIMDGTHFLCSHCAEIFPRDVAHSFRGGLACKDCQEKLYNKMAEKSCDAHVTKPIKTTADHSALFAGLEKENLSFTTRNHFSYVGH